MKIGAKVAVIFLCGIIIFSVGDIFHWYQTVRRPPPHPSHLPQLKWTRAIDPLYAISTPPILDSAGTLYVASAGAIHALDSSSVERWVYRIDPADAIAGGRLAQDGSGNLYFTTRQEIYSLSPSGLKRWQNTCSGAALAQNAEGYPFDLNLVYVTCNAHFAGLHKTDGTEIWGLPNVEPQLLSAVPSSPLLLRNGELVFSREQHIIASDRQGNTLWSYPHDQPNGAYVLGSSRDDMIYARGFSGELLVLNAKGNPQWTFNPRASGVFNENPVTAPDGTLYVIAAQGALFALAPDGKLKWRFALPPSTTIMGYTAPVLGRDGMIYQLLEDRVLALSPQGKMRWQLQLPGEPRHRGFLALAPDGTLYAVMDNSFVHAIEIGN